MSLDVYAQAAAKEPPRRVAAPPVELTLTAEEPKEWPHRTFYHCERLGEKDHADLGVPVPSKEQANLMGSLCDNGLHAPVIDLDFPVRLFPSKTAGHFHLWIDREISWRKYKRLLKAMYKAGLVEKGFYKMSVARGQSFVRLPKNTRSNCASRRCAILNVDKTTIEVAPDVVR